MQSLEQLARQSRINYTVVEGSNTHQYFINMKFAEDTLYRYKSTENEFRIRSEFVIHLQIVERINVECVY